MLGDGVHSLSEEPVQVNGLESNVKDIAVKRDYACATLYSNIVKCWGTIDTSGTYSQDATVINITNIQSNIKNIALSYTFNFNCLINNGAARCWYNPNDNQFTPINLTTGVQKIAIHNTNGYAIVNGELFTWNDISSQAIKIPVNP